MISIMSNPHQRRAAIQLPSKMSSNWHGGADPSSLSLEVELKDYSPTAMSQQYPLLSTTLKDEASPTLTAGNTTPTGGGTSSTGSNSNFAKIPPKKTHSSSSLSSERVKFTVSFQSQQRTVILGGNISSDSKKIEKLIRNAFPELKNEHRLKSKELCLFVDGHILYYPMDTIEISEIKEAHTIEVRVLDSMSEKSSDNSCHSEESRGGGGGVGGGGVGGGRLMNHDHDHHHLHLSNDHSNNKRHSSSTNTNMNIHDSNIGNSGSNSSSNGNNQLQHSNHINKNSFNSNSNVDIFFHQPHLHSHSHSQDHNHGHNAGSIHHLHQQYGMQSDNRDIRNHLEYQLMSPIHGQTGPHPANMIVDADHDHSIHHSGSYVPVIGNNLDTLMPSHPSNSPFLVYSPRDSQLGSSDVYHDGADSNGDGIVVPSQGDSEATSVVDGRKRNRGQPRRKTYHKEEKLLIMWMKDHHISVDQIIQLTTVSKSNIDKWCASKMRRHILEKYAQENPNCVISTALFAIGKLHFYHDISQPSLVAIVDKLHELQPEQLNIVIPIMLLERYDLHYPVKTRTIGMLASSTQIMVGPHSDSEDDPNDPKDPKRPRSSADIITNNSPLDEQNNAK